MSSQASALTAQHLSWQQLMDVWVQAGGKPSMAPLMAAIAMVESGGNPKATNASGATGLWQMEWPLHKGIVPAATSRAAFENPLTNAQAAVKLSGNNPSTAPGSPVYQGWLAWEPKGAYLKYLDIGAPYQGGANVSTTGSIQQSLTGGGGTGSGSQNQNLSTIEQLVADQMSSYASTKSARTAAALDGQTVGGYKGFAAFGLGAQAKEAVIGWNGVLGVGKFTLLTKGTLRKILGVSFAVLGGVVMAGGAYLTLQVLQLQRAAALVGNVPGAKAVAAPAKKVTGGATSGSGSPSTSSTTTTAGAEGAAETVPVEAAAAL